MDDCKRFSIAFLMPISWVAALAPSPKLGWYQKFTIAFLEPISWLALLATSPKLGRLQKIFNRISRTNIVTSVSRNISQAWSTSKNSSAFPAPRSWVTALAIYPKLGRLPKNYNRISRANIETTALASPLFNFFQSHIRLVNSTCYVGKW